MYNIEHNYYLYISWYTDDPSILTIYVFKQAGEEGEDYQPSDDILPPMTQKVNLVLTQNLTNFVENV